MKENYIIVKYYSSKTEDLPSGSNVVDLGDKTYKIIIPDSARDLTAMFGCTIHMKEFAGFEPTNDVGFYSEYGVEYIDMSQFDASKITNMSYMFFWNDTPEIRGARNIVNPNCTSTEGMFMFCGNLKTLDLFNMTIVSSDKMFESCSSLTSVILGYSCRILGHCAFSGCSSLSVLYVYRGAVATYTDTFYVKKQGTFLVPTGFVTPSNTGKGWECLIGQFNWTKRTGIAYNQIKAKYVVDDDDRLTFPLQLRVLGNTSAVSSMTFGGTSYTPSEFVTVSKPGTYSAVFTVDTAATSYADMFNGCMLYYESGSTKYPVGGITEVRIVNLVAGSKVTDFSRMFKNCRRLTSWLNLNKLCVSSATDLSEMFYGVGHTVEPITADWFEQWNVSKVENMSQMFRLSDFHITGLENWNVSAVTNMRLMFEQTGVDKENSYPFPDLSKWNVSSVTDLTGTFQDTILSDLTMFSNWDVSSVTKLVSTFAGTTITSTNGLEGWDVSNVTTMSMLFYWCKQLTDLTAIGNWDTSKVTNLSLAFTGCSALEDITPIVGWDVSPETCDWMLGNCTSLKKANLSNWDLSNSQTSRLFKNCTSLEKVYLSEFPLVESEMFSNCTALDDIYMYADVAPGKDTSVDDPFINIKTYGTLHIKEGATGYRDEPWTILYDVYSWNLQEGNIINIEVGPGGGTFKIEDIPSKSWSITTYPNWITVSNTSGTGDVKFSITVSPNLNETSRSTTIYVNTDTDVFTINVNQSALLVEWYWNPFAYTNNGGGEYSNTLSYNLKPDSIEFNNSDPWFEITSTTTSDDKTYVSIRIPSAGGSLTKNGSVLATLQYGDKEIQVSSDVFQYGDNYTVDPSTAVISPEGGSVVVTVESDYTLNDYTSVTGVTAGTYNMERLSSNKIQITFDFEQNYGSPISMAPKLESSLYGTNPIPLTTITQDKFDLKWDFPTTPIHLGNERSNFNIEFTSNTEIENIIISNVPDWLTFTRNGNTITGVASKNTGETRSVTLTFTADGFGVSKQLEVTQDALVWTLDTTSLLFDCTSGTPENPTSNPTSETVTYSSSTPISKITAYIQYLSGNDWLTVDYNGNIVVTATDNRLGNYRNAIITLYPDDYSISQQIYVSQYGSSFEWDATTALVDTTGGQVTFTYTAIDGYLLLSDITVANAELSWSFNGGYNGSITFTVPMNTGIARVFNPKVYAGNRLIGEFTITQEDPDITVDTPEIIAPAEGEDVIVKITSDLPWFTEVVGDWISVKPNKGEDSGNITITIAENPWNYVRTGYVYISNGIDREAIKITQVGADPILYFTKNYIPVPLKGGIKYVRLVNNTYWTTEWEIQ